MVCFVQTAKDKLKTDFKEGMTMEEALQLGVKVSVCSRGPLILALMRSLRPCARKVGRRVPVAWGAVGIRCDVRFRLRMQVLAKTMDITPEVERMEFSTLTRWGEGEALVCFASSQNRTEKSPKDALVLRWCVCWDAWVGARSPGTRQV